MAPPSPMLIPLQRLIDGVRHPASRADELADLRRRFAQAAKDDPGPAERELARELRRLVLELVEAVGEVKSCASCAKGHPLPAGRWDGGHCCSAKTSTVFAPDEVSVLHLTGTRARHLVAPQNDHAGCAFRGPTGCAVAVHHRPTLCLRYLCGELREELRDDGKKPALQLARRIDQLFDAYWRLRRVRLPVL